MTEHRQPEQSKPFTAFKGYNVYISTADSQKIHIVDQKADSRLDIEKSELAELVNSFDEYEVSE